MKPTQQTSTPQTPSPTTTATSLAPQLVEDLRAYKAAHNLSDDAIGKLTGTSGTAVNRALNGKFQGDVGTFSARISDFLLNAPKRRTEADALFTNEFAHGMHTFLETVRRTGDIGLAYSPAGKGKSTAVALYGAANPTAVIITLARWNAGAGGLERSIFSSIDTRAWRTNTSRGEFLVRRFTGSRRLLIIDNAQRLTRASREWIFDFHDATACPIALVGNPELLDAIRSNDQQFSRIGLRREIKGGKPADDAARMIQLHWPDAAGQLEAEALAVIKQQGHLRALKKQLLLAAEIAPGFDTPADAFRAAHTQLIREYTLPTAKAI